MKATELRIGNYIDEFDITMQVNSRDIGRLGEIKNKQMDNIKPIPLTEQWLIDFGLEPKQFSFEDEPSNDYFTHKDWPKEWSFYLPYCSMNIFTKNITTQFVHQFQNLHFALTGKELIK